ncbi:MAG: amidase, partial [Pseudomonadota bacterium]
MNHRDIASFGVAGLSTAFREKRITPTQALAAYEERIQSFNPQLNAFLDLRLEAARKEAQEASKRWRQDRPNSEIDGVPYGVKSNIAVTGLPWHGGIGAYGARIAKTDADVVKNLSAAGAIAVGTLNMHEGALGATTDNPFFGKCRNPWDEHCTPGGSSGGSGAAVAAGLCAFALGTDTMGSVRIPSAYCGVAGIKPTYGIVPAGGLVDLSPTLDHIGPHALNVEDLSMVLPVISGSRIKGNGDDLRIGVGQWGDAVEVEPEIAEAFDRAAAILERNFETQAIDIS